ncbi:MAG TPA: hypothetical protein VGB50_13700 [Flavobacterium sp.]
MNIKDNPLTWDPEADNNLLNHLFPYENEGSIEMLAKSEDNKKIIITDPSKLEPNNLGGMGTFQIFGKLFPYRDDRQTSAGFYSDFYGVYSNGFHVHYTSGKKNLFLLYIGSDLFSYLNGTGTPSTFEEMYRFCVKQDKHFPFSLKEFVYFFTKKISDTDFVQKNVSSDQKVYSATINSLASLVEKPTDQKTIELVSKISSLVVRMDIEANVTFSAIANEAANPFRNFWAAKRSSFTFNDLQKLEQQLLEMQNAVVKLKKADFSNAADLLDFVNKFFVASNDDQRFLIHYPFIMLDTIERTKLINLFISDGKIITDRASINSAVGSGEVLLTLLNYCSKSERLKIILDLENRKELYQLLSLSYFNCFDKLTLLIGNTYLESLQDKKPGLINLAIENGNHIFLNTNLFGTHNKENFDDQNRKITFDIKENLVLSVMGNQGVSGVMKNWIMEGTDTNGSSFQPIKSYDPLDLVVLTPVVDVQYDTHQFIAGQPYLMPACMAYYFFKEETKDVIGQVFNIVFQIVLCFTGIGEVVTAVRAGSIAATVIGGLDIAVGVGGVVVNAVPEIDRKHPEFVKYYNYFTYVWTIFRIVPAVRRSFKERKEALKKESEPKKPIGGKGPKGFGVIVGKYSGREFNPANAGGPILNLRWKNTKIDAQGLEIVKKHLSRFDDVSANRKMVARLEKILQGKLNQLIGINVSIPTK